MMRALTILSARASKRASRNSGMVMASRFWVMRRVRRPSTSHDRSAPPIALPSAIHSTSRPKPHPSLPAKPMKTTAEK